MDQRQRDFASIPATNGIFTIQLLCRKALQYTSPVMFEPVSDENRFAVCCFDEVFQRIRKALPA